VHEINTLANISASASAFASASGNLKTFLGGNQEMKSYKTGFPVFSICSVGKNGEFLVGGMSF
jgi:hypothetical protein